MSEEKFTKEQIENVALNSGIKERIQKSVWDDFIVELTKPKWSPASRQAFFNKHGIAICLQADLPSGEDRRPLITKEAGPECMKHLVDAINEACALVREEVAHASITVQRIHDVLLEALIKHRELIE